MEGSVSIVGNFLIRVCPQFQEGLDDFEPALFDGGYKGDAVGVGFFAELYIDWGTNWGHLVRIVRMNFSPFSLFLLSMQ